MTVISKFRDKRKELSLIRKYKVSKTILLELNLGNSITRLEFSSDEEDAVNEIMTTILEKSGKIVIVEKDSLKDYKRIALINRY